MKTAVVLPLVAGIVLFSPGITALNAQLAISSYTVDAGGGKSGGGSFDLGGTIAQPDASAPLTGGSLALTGGYWAADFNPHIGAYASWAAAHIAPGLDNAFDGDADSNGIANGIDYVFGEDGIQQLGRGILTALPSVIPGDVDLVLDMSPDLVTWTPILRYTAGVQTLLDPDLTIAEGRIIHAGADIRGFYRYRVELIP